MTDDQQRRRRPPTRQRERPDAAYDLTALTCTDPDNGSSTSVPNRTATIDVDPGETVHCTYTNTKGASVTINKDAIPDDPWDFHFGTQGSGLSSFFLDDDGDETNDLKSTKTFTLNASQLGEKQITETPDTDWTLTGLDCTGDNDFHATSETAHLDVDAGETIVCDFENTKDATVTVNKDAIPDDPWDFHFGTQGSGLSSFFLDDDGDETNDLKSTKTFTLNASQLGEKQITETPDTDWTLTGLDCTGDDDFHATSETAHLDVDAGETIVCDFENTKDATVTVNKDAIPDDPWDFHFGTQGSGLSSFFLDDDGDETNDLKSTKTFTLNASQLGEKQITETPDTDWTLTGLDCTGDDDFHATSETANLDVDAGETIVCDFENTKDATVTVNKDAIPDDPWDFHFGTQGSGLSSFFLDDDGDETNDLKSTKTFTLNASQLGEKQITETPDTDWTLTGLDCTGDNDFHATSETAHLDVDAGETIVCDFENTKDATVTVNKDAIPDDPWDFHFGTQGSGLSSFFLDDDGDETNDLKSTKTFTLNASQLGEKQITETPDTDWTLTGLDCTGDDDFHADQRDRAPRRRRRRDDRLRLREHQGRPLTVSSNRSYL